MTTLRPMKWSATGASLIHAKPRDDAMLRGLDDPPAVRRAVLFISTCMVSRPPTRRRRYDRSQHPAIGRRVVCRRLVATRIPNRRNPASGIVVLCFAVEIRKAGTGRRGFTGQAAPATRKRTRIRSSRRRAMRTPEVPVRSKPAQCSSNAWRGRYHPQANQPIVVLPLSAVCRRF
jgi:hypothetical protein